VTRITTTAPGKILLCGEYVVLDGAPSLCVAINRRARVEIKESESGEHSVTSPGYAEDSYLFKVDANGEFAWQTADTNRPDFSLLEKVWGSLLPAPTKPIDLVLDTRAFADTTNNQKLGLGGSAALTVALSAAIARLQHATVDVDRMIEFHRQFQNGRGSGADIAAAYTGGLIEYQMASPAMVYPMKWRDDLEFAFLWSGHSVSTAQKLSQFAAANAGSSTQRQDLAVASAAIVSAWADADAAEVISLFRSYTEILVRFSDDHDLGIFDHGHAALLDMASDCGVVYKPCGAGGGDVGMVLALSKDAMDRFTSEAASNDFVDLALSIDDDGLTVGDK
jgi:phosphomevalonate kinase